MKKTLLALALLALATSAAQADLSQGCGAQSMDPFVGLSVQQSAVKSISCTLSCGSASYTCTATTCGEFTNSNGQRCLACDGATFACCPAPPDPSCTQACWNEFNACKAACRTRDCLADCIDERSACLDLC
jgi:hypothetical protein